MSSKPQTKKVTAKKTATKKAEQAPAPVQPETVAEPVEEVVVDEKAEVVDESKEESDKKQRVRRVVSKESLDLAFKTLQERIEEEIEKLRLSKEKVKGVKFLRSLNKSLKTLRSDSVRVLKIKPKSTRPRSTSSGFMKPVKISDEMASFTGWDVNQLYSRVDVTKFICKYIKDNNLQDKKDGRQIVCDDKLKALLKYDPSTATEPLKYFSLQQYIQSHFTKNE